MSSSRPASGSPTPTISLIASVACIVPTRHRSPPTAELLVTDGRLDFVRAARGTGGVLSNVDRAELHPERVDEQQPAGERLAHSDDQRDRFRRLNRPHETRQHAEHAALGTAW